jgi:hypothetical protein
MMSRRCLLTAILIGAVAGPAQAVEPRQEGTPGEAKGGTGSTTQTYDPTTDPYNYVGATTFDDGTPLVPEWWNTGKTLTQKLHGGGTIITNPMVGRRPRQ